jgi:hypothetical protein
MKYPIRTILVVIIWSIFCSCQRGSDFDHAFEFITAADMRYFIMDENSTAKHFIGALQEIREVGPGNFIISTGDIDPPDRVKTSIDSILGKDFPWYPVMGNHEIEVIDHVQYLRNYNKDGRSLPGLVREGPPGCRETTYAFEWEDCHFVVLNQYFDGESDMGTDGDVVPSLLHWLEQDLKENTKKFIFIFGHEPIFPMPDMETGRIRHYDNSLNKYMDNNVAFIQLLRKYKVKAYICGHTHNTSYASINGLWQLDTGHSRGLEGISPDTYFPDVLGGVKDGLEKGLNLTQAVSGFYNEYSNQKDIRKGLEYMGLTEGMNYKKVGTKQVVDGLAHFYLKAQQGPSALKQLADLFWANANYSASTFMKFYVGSSRVKIEIYRDDRKGGKYSLVESIII